MKLTFYLFAFFALSSQNPVFRSEYIGEVTKLISMFDGGVALVGKNGFGRLDNFGALLYRVDEKLIDFCAEKEKLFAITEKGFKVRVFDLLTGKLQKEVNIENEPAIALTLHNNEVVVLTPRSAFNLQFPQLKANFSEYNAVSLRSSNESLTVVLREVNGFCRYNLDLSLSKSEFVECSNAQQTELKTQNDRLNFCLYAENSDTVSICVLKSEIIIRENGSALYSFAIPEIVEESLTSFVINRSIGSAIILTDRFTIIGLSLSDQKVRYIREESLGTVIGAHFVPVKKFIDPSMIRYKELAESRNIIAAWRHRMNMQVNHLLCFLSKLKNICLRIFTEETHKNDSNIFEKAVLATKVGKLHTFDFRESRFKASRVLPFENGLPLNAISKEGNLVVYTSNGEYTFDDDLQIKSPSLSDQSQLQCRVNKKSGRIELSNDRYVKWSFQLNNDERIVSFELPEYESNPKQNSLVNGNKVISKLYNLNNALLITKREKSHSVYLINLSDGRVIASFSNDKILGNIQTLISENPFILSYTHSETSISEIWVIELFRAEIEVSFSQTIRRLLLKTGIKRSSFYKPLPSPAPIVLQKKYSIAKPIKKIFSLSVGHMLPARNYVILTSTSEIFVISRDFLSARRINANQRDKIEKGIKSNSFSLNNPITAITYPSALPLYEYNIPIGELKPLIPNIGLFNVENIVIKPSKLDSTSIIAAFGKDVIFAEVETGIPFDRLSPQFRKLTIISVLLACFIVLFSLEVFLKRHGPIINFKISHRQ